MAAWIPCGDGFIMADVIRWKEGIWDRRGPRHSLKGIKIGERMLVAEVLTDPDEDGWVTLCVVRCEVLGDVWGVKQQRRKHTLDKGQRTKRKVGTIRRGKPERMEWSDESNRSYLMSRFLGNKEHMKRFMSMELEDDEWM